VSSGLIPQEIIEQVKERTDILDVVSGYVSLAKAGQNFKGLCPFHNEKSPSFMVSPSRQIFHCFGCGTGGNAFSFVMKMEGTSFPETVRELGRKAGIEVPTVQGVRPSQEAGQREKLEQINAAAQAWFGNNLMQAEAGRDARLYLKERGMFEDTVEAFGFGWAPQSWDGLLKHLLKSGYTIPELLTAGLIVQKDGAGRNPKDPSGYYDRFRSRVMLPIRDLRKQAIGFGGRILGEGSPKYLNSPETPLFNKGRALYLLEQARAAAGKTVDTLIIVEGYFDAIALHQAGITNTVATLGTALTPDHIRVIRRYVNKVVLLFDPDEAGVRAALRTLDLFVDSGLGVKVVSLPGGDDPDTFIRNQGVEAFAQLQAAAPSLLDFAVAHSLEKAGSTSIEDRIRSVDEVLRILQKTNNRLEKEEYTKRVAERLGVNQQRLIERYPELRPREQRPAAGRDAPASAASSGARFKGTPEERDLVHLLLQGQLLPAEAQRLDAETFSMPACRRIVEIALRSLEEGRVSVRATLDEALADTACATVATELSMLDQPYDNVRQHVADCLDRLERKKLEGTMSRLIAQLRAAEQAGRTEEARRLNDEVNALRLQKSGRAAASVSTTV
jgi:DNA primase